MMNKIKERVPEKFFIIVDSMAKDPKIAKRLTSTDQIKMVYELTQNVIANDLKEEDLEALKKPIDRSDVETVDYLEILEDFSARIQDKLDLAILNKQIYSVFENSEVLKKFGVSICKGSEKQKRTETGYVSDFMYLQTPFGKVEMQFQTHMNTKREIMVMLLTMLYKEKGLKNLKYRLEVIEKKLQNLELV